MHVYMYISKCACLPQFVCVNVEAKDDVNYCLYVHPQLATHYLMHEVHYGFPDFCLNE